MEIKLFDTVRIKKEQKGSRNEFGRVVGFSDSGLVWVSNLNSPFQGTISEFFPKDELENVIKSRTIHIVVKKYIAEVHYKIQPEDMDYYEEVKKETGKSIEEIMEENILECGVVGSNDLDIDEINYVEIMLDKQA